MAAGALACFLLLAWAYAIEYIYHIEPCPLCILQRILYWILGMIYLIGACHNPQTWLRYLYSMGAFFFCIMGTLLAGRQVWLQHLPIHEVPSCTAGLDRLLEIYPLLEVLKTILNSSGECAIVSFTIMGLSLAESSLLCFVLLSALSLWIMIGQKRKI